MMNEQGFPKNKRVYYPSAGDDMITSIPMVCAGSPHHDFDQAGAMNKVDTGSGPDGVDEFVTFAVHVCRFCLTYVYFEMQRGSMPSQMAEMEDADAKGKPKRPN